MKTLTQHETLAASIAATAPPETPTAYTCARQGDVILRRIRDLTPAELADVPATPANLLLGAGVHGEHRLVGPGAYAIDQTLIATHGSAVVVHTDIPAARHGAIRLGCGVWSPSIQRELRGEEVVEVRD